MGSDCWLDQIQISQQQRRQGRTSGLFHVFANYNLVCLLKSRSKSLLAPQPKCCNINETTDDRHLFFFFFLPFLFSYLDCVFSHVELGVTRFRVESGTNLIQWPHPQCASVVAILLWSRCRIAPQQSGAAIAITFTFFLLKSRTIIFEFRLIPPAAVIGLLDSFICTGATKICNNNL